MAKIATAQNGPKLLRLNNVLKHQVNFGSGNGFLSENSRCCHVESVKFASMEMESTVVLGILRREKSKKVWLYTEMMLKYMQIFH